MMSILTYNMDDGYAEGICRGYRGSMLNSTQYLNLAQCENLEDLRLQLSATSYGPLLANEPSPLATSTIAEKCTEVLVEEYRYLQSNAVGDLKRFLEYVTYGYMIDNVILLITGTLHERDTHELLERCHPLGTWDSMPALCVATNVVELYNTVLVDTPLAPYFKNCLSAHDLDELNIEIIRNTLYKAYLEDFERVCREEMDPITGELMHEILSFEADRRTINITINSFGTELTKEQRSKLYPSLGRLFPDGHTAMTRADEVEHVRAICEIHPVFFNLFRMMFNIHVAISWIF